MKFRVNIILVLFLSLIGCNNTNEQSIPKSWINYNSGKYVFYEYYNIDNFNKTIVFTNEVY